MVINSTYKIPQYFCINTHCCMNSTGKCYDWRPSCYGRIGAVDVTTFTQAHTVIPAHFGITADLKINKAAESIT